MESLQYIDLAPSWYSLCIPAVKSYHSYEPHKVTPTPKSTADVDSTFRHVSNFDIDRAAELSSDPADNHAAA